jgi:uncharacterized protein (TIGR00288 family)
LEQNLCVLIDFENVAAGTEKEGYGRFDIRLVMRRLKDKGRILVARSYGDWGRFAKFKQSLLEQGITMVELTSYRGQDKNRADIAMVVDAMELAFTRAYLDTFVILSGDSDFTPLVTRLKELNKHVIGIGTRKSTSRLLVEACDEFMFYDVLKRGEIVEPRPRRKEEEDEGEDAREAVALTRAQAFQLLKETIEGLQRDTDESVHASVVKASMLRKEPAFDELEYGFNSFARFLESAEKDGVVQLTREPGRGGGYRVESAGEGASAHREGGASSHRDGGSSHRDGASSHRDGASSRDGGSSHRSAPPHRAENGADADAEPNGHAHLSPEAERYRGLLIEAGLDPLTPELRRSVVTAFVDEVAERTSANKRVNLQGATSAVARRARPKVGTKAVGAVLDALFKAGELIHADGNPVRSPSASFVVPKNADALLLSLQSHYLKTILEEENGPPDSRALAELLLGDAADAQDIEALMAWLVYETDQRATAEASQSEPPAMEAEAEAAADVEALPPEPEEEEPTPKKKKAPTRKPRRKIAGRDAETGS